MPSCEEALAAIYEFLDGELDDMSRERVQAHFDVCGKCYPKLRFEESFRSAVQKASAGQAPPPDLRAKLLDLLARAQRAEEDN
jgi:mycothiol system anti-sigma-R factor